MFATEFLKVYFDNMNGKKKVYSYTSYFLTDCFPLAIIDIIQVDIISDFLIGLSGILFHAIPFLCIFYYIFYCVLF